MAPNNADSRPSSPETGELELTYDNAKARVLVIYTGGTIGMVPSDPTNPDSPLTPGDKEQLSTFMPGLGVKARIYWEIEGLRDVPPLDSSDVNSVHWLKMAEAIEEAYEKWDGFIILHGTDTMAYTTSGLSFLLSNLAKPVIVTGSQLPISEERTDARLNFANAINIAGYKATGLPLVSEVVLCFGNRLLRGNRARKMSTSDLNGFDSPNCPWLGKLGEYIEINRELLRPPAEESFYLNRVLNTNVMDIGLFPGLTVEVLKTLMVENDNIKGFVMRTFGAGNAPGDPEFLRVLKQAISEKDKVIINVTHCPNGMVEMGLYAASSSLLELGVISGLDMTPEAALAKMFWILGTERGQQIPIQMQIDQRGEQSESLFDLRYGPGGDQQNPTEITSGGVQPSGKFRKETLNRALLRISGLAFTDVAEGADFEIRVFVNLPSATPDTPVRDPHCAAIFKERYAGPGKTLIKDITSQIRRFTEVGRDISINVVSTNGHKFWYQGLFIGLFART
ncbi:MAG TPA: asparaginase [Pyrinomonadaceae bacterium]|nr:asparaginase [Pyrinomonadaceae bacterium]